MQKILIYKCTYPILFWVGFLVSPGFIYCQATSDSLWKKEYYQDGKLKAEGALVSGQKKGLWKYYYPNQVLSAEEFYKEDLLDGKRKTFDFEGKLQTLENWVDGVEEDSSFSYYPNGIVHRKGAYRNGLYEGVWYTYYENGKLKNQGSYKQGNPEGFWMFWNEKGIKTHEGNFLNGKESGPWKIYNSKKGFLEFEGEYKDGKRVKTWKEFDSKGKIKRSFIPD